MGFGTSCNLMGSFKLLTLWFSPAQFATLSAVIPSVGALGTITSATPLVLMAETIGWHTLQELKTDQEVGQIPVIVCSWLDEEARGLEQGADIYLRMPILYADFDIALESLLDKRAK